MTKVLYYVSPNGDRPIKSFLDSLSEKQQSKILRIIEYIKEYSLQSILPHVKKLTGTPLWEIRIIGKDNIRIIYVIPFKIIVLILHGFIKKSKKTPSKEIGIALYRYKEWLTRYSNALDK